MVDEGNCVSIVYVLQKRRRTMKNEEIVREIKSGNNRTENILKLWRNMENLIVKIAKGFNGYAELEDLIQEGFCALYDAIKYYDENKGSTFSSYAVYWIKARINRYVCECTRPIRIPENAEYERRRYNKLISKYEKDYGRKPGRVEICYFLNIKEENLIRIEKSVNVVNMSSLDKRIDTSEDESAILMDVIPSGEDENSIIEQIDNKMLQERLGEVIRKLPELEQKVIVYRYLEELNKKEIAQKLKMSEKDIYRMQVKALNKLRKTKEIQMYYSERKKVDVYQHIGISNYNRTWNSITERAALEL